MVARSGTEGLGQWFNEERDVYRDYGEKIGGALPAKLVRDFLCPLSILIENRNLPDLQQAAERVRVISADETGTD